MELPEALSFDDVLLLPGKSDVLPAETDLKTLFSKNIQLNIPLSSAAMDTVTEAPMAIAIARLGGIGVIHRNMTTEDQAAEVDKVKRSESGMIVDPIRVGPGTKIRDVLAIMDKYRISGVPVTNPAGRLLGILTNRDLRFATDLDAPAAALMT
ncbi:MAG TPA: IMP dehydrogenase, partial [Acidobacteriota bacterium]|nr:IMP dehydrogenase [Acidobacteriota bacterium]